MLCSPLIPGGAERAEHILVSEEEHLDWLEALLRLLPTLGEELYPAQQLRPAGD